MKYVSLFEQFITESEKAKSAKPELMAGNSALGKKLIQAAIKQYDDKYQDAYTVDVGGKKIQFSTVDALTSLDGRNEQDAPFDWGVNGPDGDGKVFIFGGGSYMDEEELFGKIDTNGKLSAALKVYVSALKAAKAKAKG
jgi:hypothetical protein